MLAHPLETIQSSSTEKVARRVQKIVAERQVNCVVVGLPRQMNGVLGLAAKNAQHFVEKLRSLVSCEVVTWDERLSTVAAERALRDAGKKTRETRGIRDQVAAQIILQSYLDRPNAQIRSAPVRHPVRRALFLRLA